MAKLTTQIIKDLYSYGKAVYDRQIGLNDATDAVLAKYPEQIAESSASFYIGLYAEYMSGKGSTWNQNSELVLYYVEHITKETGLDAGKKAFQAGMKFAQAKSKKELIKALGELWKSLSGETVSQEAEDSWWPSLSEYNPDISKDQWLELLQDGTTFTDNAYFAIAAMYDYGGEATCRQLADRYGQKSDFYRTSLGVQVADKVKKKLQELYDLSGLPPGPIANMPDISVTLDVSTFVKSILFNFNPLTNNSELSSGNTTPGSKERFSQFQVIPLVICTLL